MNTSHTHENLLLQPAQLVEHQWPVNMEDTDISEFEAERSYHTYDSKLVFKGRVSVSPDAVIYKGYALDQETTVSLHHVPYYRFKHQVKESLPDR